MPILKSPMARPSAEIIFRNSESSLPLLVHKTVSLVANEIKWLPAQGRAPGAPPARAHPLAPGARGRDGPLGGDRVAHYARPRPPPGPPGGRADEARARAAHAGPRAQRRGRARPGGQPALPRAAVGGAGPAWRGAAPRERAPPLEARPRRRARPPPPDRPLALP